MPPGPWTVPFGLRRAEPPRRPRRTLCAAGPPLTSVPGLGPPIPTEGLSLHRPAAGHRSSAWGGLGGDLQDSAWERQRPAAPRHLCQREAAVGASSLITGLGPLPPLGCHRIKHEHGPRCARPRPQGQPSRTPVPARKGNRARGERAVGPAADGLTVAVWDRRAGTQRGDSSRIDDGTPSRVLRGSVDVRQSAFKTDSMSRDPTETNPDLYKVVFENERVRVLEYQDVPGDRTTPHGHPDSVMVTLSDFDRRLTRRPSPRSLPQVGPGCMVTCADPHGRERWPHAYARDVRGTERSSPTEPAAGDALGSPSVSGFPQHSWSIGGRPPGHADRGIGPFRMRRGGRVGAQRRPDAIGPCVDFRRSLTPFAPGRTVHNKSAAVTNRPELEGRRLDHVGARVRVWVTHPWRVGSAVAIAASAAGCPAEAAASAMGGGGAELLRF